MEEDEDTEARRAREKRMAAAHWLLAPHHPFRAFYDWCILITMFISFVILPTYVALRPRWDIYCRILDFSTRCDLPTREFNSYDIPLAFIYVAYGFDLVLGFFSCFNRTLLLDNNGNDHSQSIQYEPLDARIWHYLQRDVFYDKHKRLQEKKGGCYGGGTVMVISRERIFVRYLFRFFPWDFLAAMPWPFILTFEHGKYSFTYIAALSIIYLKFYNIGAGRIKDRYKIAVTTFIGDGVNVQRLLLLISTIFVTSYYAGCFFYFIGGLEVDMGVGDSWLILHDHDPLTDPVSGSFASVPCFVAVSVTSMVPSTCRTAIAAIHVSSFSPFLFYLTLIFSSSLYRNKNKKSFLFLQPFPPSPLPSPLSFSYHLSVCLICVSPLFCRHLIH